jgi:hypothetical protein
MGDRENGRSCAGAAMNKLDALLIACAAAFLTPMLSSGGPNEHPPEAEGPRWPTHFQGRPLEEIPLDERERRRLSVFPGAIARFTDGQREILMRWVTQPTRRLHPAEDCYRALGYDVSQQRIMRDANASQWRCFIARRANGARHVCEQLQDQDGQRWSDVSAWYWSAALRGSRAPWLVTTVAAASR